MKSNSLVIIILSCLVMVNCASNIKSKKFTDKDLDSYNSYAYLMDTSASASEFNRTTDVSADEMAVATLKDRMNEEGFSMDTNNPDLVVLISGSTGINSTLKKDGQNRGAAASSSSGSPYSASSGSGNNSKSTKKSTSSSRPYQSGNMTIEVFDNKTKELVWVGMVKNYKTDIAATAVSSSMVNAIFRKFPKS